MKIIKVIVIAALVWIATYLSVGFILWDFSPGSWSHGARFALVWVAVLLSIIANAASILP